MPSPLTSSSKEELERDKLFLEVEAIRHPLRRNPTFWVSLVTTVLAVAAVILQYGLSHTEYLAAENKRVLADIQRIQTEQEIEAKKKELADITQQLAAAQSQLEHAHAELDHATEIMARAKPSVAPALQRDIEAFSQRRKEFILPTRALPLRVSPSPP